MTVSGPATYKLIRNLSAPKKPAEKSYDELVALVKSHYTPKPSVIVQRFQFHSRTQKLGETVVTFVAELRQLSEFCEFCASLEDMLRDRLVCGIASGSTQRRLLAEPDLTLQKAQNLAQAIESADKNAKYLQGQRSPPMTAVNAVTSKRRPPRGTRARVETGRSMEIACYRCGGRHAPRDCRFKDAVCHSCKKRGHLARVCRSKRTQCTAAGRCSNGGKQPQQTHALESETRSPASEQEAYTLFPVNCQRASAIEVSVTVDGVAMSG